MEKNERIVHYDITVYGRVQGVGYRYSAENMARQFGVSGIIKNMYDGSVYLEIEGTPASTGLMIEWCREGPRSARVINISVFEGNLKGYESFRITR